MNNTIMYLIKVLYGITLNKSNVYYLLNKYNIIIGLLVNDLSKGEGYIFEYKEDNIGYEDCFGEDYLETIGYEQLIELHEYFTNEYELITKYIDKYKGYGKKLTKDTKLYDIFDYLNLQESLEQAKQAQTSINPKDIAKEVYNQLFIENSKKDTVYARDSDDYLRDLQIAKQYAKKAKK